jgi:acetyl esterase/lipase
MTKFLATLAVVAACHNDAMPGDDDTNPDGSPPPTFVDDPGLDGAPFTLDDASCSEQSGHILCDDVVFSVVDGTSLHLDLQVPLAARTGRVPAIMYVHGGGWLAGSWNEFGLDVPTYLAAGYAVLSVEYRLTADPFPNRTGIQFPQNLQDVKTAVRWLRIKAAGFIDADRILAYGFSAGAHLVSVLGTTAGDAEFEGRGDPSISSTPNGVVALSAPLDFHLFFPMNPPLDASCPPQDPPRPGGTPADGVSLLLGVDPASFETLADSPKLEWVTAMSYVSASTSPMLLFAGTCDQTVPYAGLAEMAAAAQAVGAPVETFLAQGAKHGGTLGSPEAKAKLAAFIAARLGS